jgi:hypothetical protein
MIASSQQQEDQQHWQAPHKSMLDSRAFVQVLAAAVVLLVGLLLVYPSILLQGVTAEQQPSSDGQL